MLSIIVASTPSGIIGQNNRIPWHNSLDQKLFKKRTLGNPVVMGRKTAESLPHGYLKKRYNIILSNTISPHSTFKPDFTQVCYVSDWSVIKWFSEQTEREVFLIGGQSLYDYALQNQLVSRIYHSVLLNEPEGLVGDTWFKFKYSEFILTDRREYKDFDVYTWERETNFAE